MCKFSLIKITESGENVFSTLAINDICPYDLFVNEFIKTYEKELAKLYWLIKAITEGHAFPDDKVKYITNKKDSVTEFELKTKHLRVYCIKLKSNRIIILGGFKSKNNQQKDITHFRNIKKEYLESINYGNERCY